MSNALTKVNDKDTEIVSYIPLGNTTEIKLSIAIIINQIAKPTKAGIKPSRQNAIEFMMRCRAQRLNPFEGDAYLVGYDTADGAVFATITSHLNFLKRAEDNKDFEGMQSGLILINDNTGELTEREGDFFLESEKAVGAWAKVYRSNLKFPMVCKIRIDKFDTKRSQWSKNKEGMATKCARVGALRMAFPQSLGGMYAPEEIRELSLKENISSQTLFGEIVDNGDDTDLAPTRKLPISQGKHDDMAMDDQPATKEQELLK